MRKTFKVTEAYIGNKTIEVWENGDCILKIILSNYNVDGAVKILEALGYQLLYRDY